MNIQSNTQPAVTPLYECCSEVHQVLNSVRGQLHQLCNEHIHRLVKIETIDGDVFEGHIMHFDNSNLYLSLSNEGTHVLLSRVSDSRHLIQATISSSRWYCSIFSPYRCYKLVQQVI